MGDIKNTDGGSNPMVFRNDAPELKRELVACEFDNFTTSGKMPRIKGSCFTHKKKNVNKKYITVKNMNLG
jgi:hypothetical protein